MSVAVTIEQVLSDSSSVRHWWATNGATVTTTGRWRAEDVNSGVLVGRGFICFLFIFFFFLTVQNKQDDRVGPTVWNKVDAHTAIPSAHEFVWVYVC